MREWLEMTAADLGRGIAAGDIDPVALCDTFLDAIDAHPMHDRIYARVTPERARAEAAAAAERLAFTTTSQGREIMCLFFLKTSRS